MDLFVVDNLGDNGDLEDHSIPILPKTKTWRKSISSTTTSEQLKNASVEEEDEVDSDEDDEDDDDGDYGGKLNTF